MADTSASCEALRSKYQAGFASLVAEVRAKSPLLLIEYASNLGGSPSSRVPSRAAALRALNAVKPSCLKSLDAATCGKLIASAKSFINRSSTLNARFEAQKCPGKLAG